MDLYFKFHRWICSNNLFLNMLSRRNFLKFNIFLLLMMLLLCAYWSFYRIPLEKSGTQLFYWIFSLIFSYFYLWEDISSHGRNCLGGVILAIIFPTIIKILLQIVESSQMNLLPFFAMILFGVIMIIKEQVEDDIKLLRYVGCSGLWKIKWHYFARDREMKQQEKIWAQQKEFQNFKDYLINEEKTWYQKTIVEKWQMIQEITLFEMQYTTVKETPKILMSNDFNGNEYYMSGRINKKDNIIFLNQDLLEYLSLEEILQTILFALQELKVNELIATLDQSSEKETIRLLYKNFEQKKESIFYDVLTGYYAAQKGSFIFERKSLHINPYLTVE